MPDRPLLSPRRLWMALRRWLWYQCVVGVDMPFSYFMRFEDRPVACAHYRKTHKVALTYLPDVYLRLGTCHDPARWERAQERAARRYALMPRLAFAAHDEVVGEI